MARSVFYYHRAFLDKPDIYDSTKDSIKTIYDDSKGRYGYRRITITLRAEGQLINHKTVQKLMVQMDLRAKRKKRHYRYYKGDIGQIAPNVINRDFMIDKPNKKWATDVTQININEDKTYFSPILDMYNGEIISYTISKSPNLKMVTDMLRNAFHSNNTLDGLVLHSDQGWHYQHKEYQKILKGKNITQSMSVLTPFICIKWIHT